VIPARRSRRGQKYLPPTATWGVTKFTVSNKRMPTHSSPFAPEGEVKV
jgi:hypothetical protein